MKSAPQHPLTKEHLAALKRSQPQSILLYGAPGSGKALLAKQLIENLLDLKPSFFDSYAYKLLLAPNDRQTIGIEAVRELEHFMRLKVPTDTLPNRAVIISDSQYLTIEAQNALLKLLEEPGDGTVLVLTATRPQALLPTIRSRLQQIHVRRPDKAALRDYFSDDYAAEAIERAYAMSGGLPGLMQALLVDDKHRLRQAANSARQFLSQSVFERLASVDEIAKQKAELIDFVFILQQMAHTGLQTVEGKSAGRWQGVLEAAYEAQQSLEAYGQPKLVLTKLALSV